MTSDVLKTDLRIVRDQSKDILTTSRLETFLRSPQEYLMTWQPRIRQTVRLNDLLRIPAGRVRFISSTGIICSAFHECLCFRTPSSPSTCNVRDLNMYVSRPSSFLTYRRTLSYLTFHTSNLSRLCRNISWLAIRLMRLAPHSYITARVFG